MNSKTFGELIKKTRTQKKIPLREVAAYLKIDQSILSKIERDKMVASEKIVLPLSKCLNIDYKDLQIKYLSERIYRELKHTEFSAEALEITLKRLEKEQTGTLHETTREKLLSKITAYLVTSPIDKAWLFGSFARSEESYDSDIDLLIRFIKPNKVDLFDYIGIRQDLEDLTGRQIDLVEEGQLIEKLKPIIHNEKQLIYAR